jgi:hypothetical protein
MRLRRVLMTRYLSGLCVAGLGLCAGGWLVVTTVAFGSLDGLRADPPRLVNLATGAALLLLSALTAAAWAVTWRRRLRADGVLGAVAPRVPRREARRNRRRLARDIREAARVARRETRTAGPATGDFGVKGYVPEAAGHDGASAAELLGELRALLAPLLAAAGPGQPADPVARRWPAAWTAPAHPVASPAAETEEASW